MVRPSPACAAPDWSISHRSGKACRGFLAGGSTDIAARLINIRSARRRASLRSIEHRGGAGDIRPQEHDELIARANPGKLNWTSPGSATTLHLAGEVLKLRTGIPDARARQTSTRMLIVSIYGIVLINILV